jgi:hypothetical protein
MSSKTTALFAFAMGACGLGACGGSSSSLEVKTDPDTTGMDASVPASDDSGANDHGATDATVDPDTDAEDRDVAASFDSGSIPTDAPSGSGDAQSDAPEGTPDASATTDTGAPDAEAGASPRTDASTEAGTGSPCTPDAGCDSGEVCAYLIADACAAVGTCVMRPAPGLCGAIVLETACGCDGSAVHWDGGCSPSLPDGYAPAPVRHTGTCSPAATP